MYRSLATAGILTVTLAHDTGDGVGTGSGVVDLARVAERVSRTEGYQVEALDPNEVLEHTLGAVLPQLEQRGIVVQQDLCSESIRVAGSVSDLEAIVFNLTANAITSLAHARDLQGDRAILLRTRVDGDQLVVDFSDSGPGIADVDTLDMWRPGVSGGKSKGIGLGLTVVRDAVADMCGNRSVLEEGNLSADAYGELGGASFHIRLPLWRDE
jgi:signal transduction histidine kinase